MMDCKECLRDGENVDDFMIIKQTLNDLCERVCGLTDLNSESKGSSQINCAKPGTPKEIFGDVKAIVAPMVTPRENGHSDLPECTTINNAVSNDMEYHTCADTVPTMDNKSRRSSASEASHYGCENNANFQAVKKHCHAEPCCNFVTTLEKVQDTCSKPKYCKMDISIANTKNAERNEMVLSKGDVADHGNASKVSDERALLPESYNIISEVEDKNGLEHENSISSCLVKAYSNSEKTDQMCSQKANKNVQDKIKKNQSGDSVNDGSEQNQKISGKTSNISGRCSTSEIRHKVVSEKGDECVSDTEDSPSGFATKRHSNFKVMDEECYQETIKNEQNKVGKNQVVDTEMWNVCTGQKTMDSKISKHAGKDKPSNNKLSNCQSQSILTSISDPCEGNMAANDFLFVLNVVKQDVKQMQISNDSAGDTPPNVNVHQDLVKNENKSSESSSSSLSSSDSSTDESDSESSESSQEIRKLIEEEEDKVTGGPPKTKDELLLSDLPPPPPVNIMADENLKIKPLGEIESILHEEGMVIIKSLPGVPAIDSDSILFLNNGQGFGQVFDIFGQVNSPHYCVRFTNEEEIMAKNLSIGQTIFYAPDANSLTNFVFVSQLQRMKGSDASWQHDQEPPEEVVEYSDDEAELLAKAAKKKANRLKKRDQTHVQKGTPKKLRKEQPSTPTTACSLKPPQPQWREKANYPPHQPEAFYQTAIPRNLQTGSNGERFPQRHNSVLQFHPRSQPPKFGLHVVEQSPSRNPYHQQQVPQHPQQPPPPAIAHQPRAGEDFNYMFGPGSGQPCPVNGQPPPRNLRPPVDQRWLPRGNFHPNGQPVNQVPFTTRPRWPAVHPQAQPGTPNNRPPFCFPPR